MAFNRNYILKMSSKEHQQSTRELEQKLNQLHEQGIVSEAANERIKELERIEAKVPEMKKDKELNKMLKLFKALANKNRLLILKLLINGVRCACEIEHLLGLSQSTVSHHISTLIEVGAIEAIKSGKWNLVELPENSFSKEYFFSLIEETLA